MNTKIMVCVMVMLYPFLCYGGNGITINNKFRKLGKIPAGTIVKERYYLANHTNSTINILYVNPDCSCTDYFVSSYTVQPHDSVYIDLTVNTEHKFGEEVLYTVVKTDSETSMYKLTLKFYVEDE